MIFDGKIGVLFAAIRSTDKEISMRIEKYQSDGVPTLRLEGEIDLHNSPELRAMLASCASEKAPFLLLDFQGVSYIDSSGLGALIEHMKASTAFGGKIGLFGVPKKVLMVFEIVRMDKMFYIGTDAPSTLALMGHKSSSKSND
jgi:anti-sigma B factor antagonist